MCDRSNSKEGKVNERDLGAILVWSRPGLVLGAGKKDSGQTVN